MLRADREITESEIQSLDLEKESLQTVRFNCLFVLNVIIFNYLLLFIQIIPKVIAALIEKRDRIEGIQNEIKLYDKAISDIETNYGHIIFSPAFYTG